MSKTLKPLITRLCNGEQLSFEEMQTAFSILMNGDATIAQIASFMIALKMRGETASDIAAGASKMRANASRTISWSSANTTRIGEFNTDIKYLLNLAPQI